MLPEFHAHRLIEWDMYVDDSTSLTTYDMIVGRDLMDSIGLDLIFSENLMRWDNATVPMRTIAFSWKIVQIHLKSYCPCMTQ